MRMYPTQSLGGTGKTLERRVHLVASKTLAQLVWAGRGRSGVHAAYTSMISTCKVNKTQQRLRCDSKHCRDAYRTFMVLRAAALTGPRPTAVTNNFPQRNKVASNTTCKSEFLCLKYFKIIHKVFLKGKKTLKEETSIFSVHCQ
jgi:hypothetical protein